MTTLEMLLTANSNQLFEQPSNGIASGAEWLRKLKEAGDARLQLPVVVFPTGQVFWAPSDGARTFSTPMFTYVGCEAPGCESGAVEMSNGKFLCSGCATGTGT